MKSICFPYFFCSDQLMKMKMKDVPHRNLDWGNRIQDSVLLLNRLQEDCGRELSTILPASDVEEEAEAEAPENMPLQLPLHPF
jgi:hypothetical protein